MAIREASAQWQGTLKEGSGRLRLGSGVFEGAYSFPSRFESGPGTNPEELIAAAHAGCFSMALTAILGGEGHTPHSIHTIAKVHLGASTAGPTITQWDWDSPNIPRAFTVQCKVLPGKISMTYNLDRKPDLTVVLDRSNVELMRQIMLAYSKDLIDLDA